ncbi:hypothetical protein KJ603_01885 [Patescibacteria group bacterium]|nr:hypothetical protein [Patescibacteria group bacterium]
MKTLKFKDSDLFVDSVKSKKEMFVLLILLSVVGFILFCFFAFVYEAKITQQEIINDGVNSGMGEIPQIYEKDGKFFIHKSPADMVVDKAPKEWSVPLKNQEALILGVTKYIDIPYAVNTMVLWKYIFPLKETIIFTKRITLENGVFTPVELEKSQPTFKINFLFLILIVAIVLFGGIAGLYSEKKKDKLLIVRVFLAFASVSLIPLFRCFFGGLTTPMIALFLCIILILAIAFFYSLHSNDFEGENFFLFMFSSFVTGVIIVINYETNLVITLYLSFFYFISYLSSFFLFRRKEKDKIGEGKRLIACYNDPE